jgi:hypothetical protein
MEIASDKYKTRPYHASEYKDKVKKGNDGQMYRSISDKRGVYSWKLVTKTRKARGTRFVTVNNGANLWVVEDFPKENRAIIYKKNLDDEVKVTEMKYNALFPSDKSSAKFAEDWSKGNTVLIQKSKEKFIIVYDNISEFELESGDTIEKFMSPIGNNDSPYPYIIGKKNIYFIYESGFFQYVKRELIDLDVDVIQQMIKMSGKKLREKVLYKPCDCRWRGVTRCAKPCR